MSIVVIRFERSAEPHRALWPINGRRMLLALLGALDRLAPWPSGDPRDAELPEEWFKYPPI